MASRILYLHGIGAIGGAERDLLALLDRLDRTSWQPTVACPETGALRHEIEKLNVPVLPIDLPPWRKLSSVFRRSRAVARLRRVIAECRPRLVHVNDIWWVPHAVRAGTAGDRAAPIIAHVRQEIEPAKVRHYGLETLEYVVAISRQVERSLEAGGVPKAKLSTIYSGIDQERIASCPREATIRERLGIQAGATILGTVAHLFPRKGYHVFLQAFPAILAAVPDVHYVAVGGGDAVYADELKAAAETLGIAHRVHFIGFQDPVYPCLAEMDLYVHPALMEGFGIAVVEAMAMGKAVVATTAGGLPEVVEEGRTGLLVPPGDAAALAEAILALLRNSIRRHEMGIKAMDRVRERFDLRRSVEEIQQVYRKALGSDANRN